MKSNQLVEVPRGGGRIVVEVSGSGPLVLCIPGMGESRGSFRHLAPLLVAAGYRVAVMDLRGHGDSSAEFDAYDDAAGAGDALVLIGPFVRDHGSAASRALMRILLARPWGPGAWKGYYGSLFGERRPADHAEHAARALELLRRPGRWRAFQRTARSSHAAADAALPEVDAATLVVMGERDRDFPDPAAEAAWIAAALRGERRVVPGAGHYPQGEQPDTVAGMIIPFLRDAAERGSARG
ncbi:alpha/beta fold hydrolase [Leucobacter luti]|uniref:alpha/beta fold hydrolase n=1 Tax=Leucobacter luti TaxID=340320 RepID=UPI003D01A1A1